MPLVGVDAMSVEWSAGVERGRLCEEGSSRGFEGSKKEELSFVDEAGGLSRLQRHGVLSAQTALEDHHLTDPHCLLIIIIQFLSHPKLQSNRLLLLGVTLHRTASRICCLLSTGSQTRCLSGFPDASELCLRPICG